VAITESSSFRRPQYVARNTSPRPDGLSFQFPQTGTKAMMRLSRSVLAIAMTATMAGSALAADLAIPPSPAKEVSVHKGPPHCSRWTDDCVNCARDGSNGAPPVCSNTGFSCQPKSVRCLEP
jgi:hypothetical protein